MTGTTTLATVTLLAAMAAVAAAHPGHRPVPAPVTAAAVDHGAPRFDFQPPRPGTYRLPVIRPAADGIVLDESGRRRRLHELMDGRITVVSFIYTRCSDRFGCPLATTVLHQAREMASADRALLRSLKMLTVSFDVVHDTPAVLAGYARPARGTDARLAPWDFAVPPTERDLGAILEAYGQTIQRPSGDAITHLLRVYLIDRRQRIRNIYGLDFMDPRLLLGDVRTLLLEEQRAGR
jgi:protein SCO1/2